MSAYMDVSLCLIASQIVAILVFASTEIKTMAIFKINLIMSKEIHTFPCRKEKKCEVISRLMTMHANYK